VRVRARARTERYAFRLQIPSWRIQFMPKLDLWRHLRRLAACDVFLDNTEYNSGTTAGDVFWSEVLRPSLAVLTSTGGPLSPFLGSTHQYG
jgi:predicted O-linked N-acetylglucosamine transferase (SPINDLY family)